MDYGVSNEQVISFMQLYCGPSFTLWFEESDFYDEDW